MAAEIRSIHEAAIERASDDDKDWFAANPGRKWRLRDPVQFEMNQRLQEAPSGFTQRILAYQAAPGVRMRFPIFINEQLSNEGATDADLARAFDLLMPPEAKESKAKVDAAMAEKGDREA